MKEHEPHEIEAALEKERQGSGNFYGEALVRGVPESFFEDTLFDESQYILPDHEGEALEPGQLGKIVTGWCDMGTYLERE